MNVLIDYHHSDLMESLHRLFEDRLGLTVYMPYGLEWFTEGIWRQGHQHFGDALARQFLLTPEVDELQPHRKLRRLTLEEAKGMDWTLILASVPDNYEGYARFAKEHDARFGIEVGNVNQWVDMRNDPLVLDSTGMYGVGVPFTPEFDMGEFAYSTPPSERRVSSFVNLFPGLPCYPDFLATMTAVDPPLMTGIFSDWEPTWNAAIYGHDWEPTWTAAIYGHNGQDGFIKPTSSIAPLMGASSFGWHDKVTGDGFGYVIHYWASVGRPLIGHASHYRGQIAADLWDDLVTCIDLDLHSPEEAAGLMEDIVRSPDRHAEMCHTIAERVRRRIDWPQDAARVADALGVSGVKVPVAA